MTRLVRDEDAKLRTRIVRQSTSAGTGATDLPTRRTLFRLRVAVVLYIVALVFGNAPKWFLDPSNYPSTWEWSTAQIEDSGRVSFLATALALSFLLFLFVGQLSAQSVRNAGRIFWVAGGFGIAAATTYEVHGHIEWVAVWILAAPLVLPSRPRETLAVSLASACAVPVAYAVHNARGLVADADAASLATFFAPNFVCALIATGASVLIFRLAAERARRLGAYSLTEKIGGGGMGEVWRAEHRYLARAAAIKLVRSDRADGLAGDEARARFEREAHATALLRSPHTVELYDFGMTDEGDHYYVMELLDGVDLAVHVAEHGPVSAGRMVHLLQQACLSLAEAHAHGLVHRDIKPSNIIVTHAGIAHDFIKVLDFGLVSRGAALKMEETITQDHMVSGTPAFLPPETAARGDATAASDIYGLGCVAYWLLTGELVFERDTTLEMLFAHAKDEPVPPSERTELDIPPDIDAIVLACLAKDPADRPSSARALRQRLLRSSVAGDWDEQKAEAFWVQHHGESIPPSAAVQQ